MSATVADVMTTRVIAVKGSADVEIRAEVLGDVIAGEFGLDPAEFDVGVASGVVTVVGPLAQLETALALPARVRHLEGVVAVRDRLIVARTSGQAMASR
jgi:hypothetical protein